MKRTTDLSGVAAAEAAKADSKALAAAAAAAEAAAAEWEKQAKRLLKSELARAGASYKVLAARLEEIGIKDNESAIASRVSRGKFSLAFFLQCMHVIGAESVKLR